MYRMPYKDIENRRACQRRFEHSDSRRAERKLYIQECMEFARSFLVGRSCLQCGEERIRKLCFHHRDSKTKKFKLSDGRPHSHKAIIAEIAKCDILCKSCHNRLHSKLRWAIRKEQANAI